MGSCLTTNHCWMPSKFQPPNFPTVILLFVWLPKYQHYCIKQHNLTNDMNKAAAFPRSPPLFLIGGWQKDISPVTWKFQLPWWGQQVVSREIATTRTINSDNSDGKFFKMDLPKPKRRTFYLCQSANRHHTIHKVDNVIPWLRQPPFISKCSSPSLGSFKFVKGAMQEIKYMTCFILSSNWTNLIRHAA